MDKSRVTEFSGQEFQFKLGCARTVAAPYFLKINMDREPEPPTQRTDQKLTLWSLRVPPDPAP